MFVSALESNGKYQELSAVLRPKIVWTKAEISQSYDFVVIQRYDVSAERRSCIMQKLLQDFGNCFSIFNSLDRIDCELRISVLVACLRLGFALFTKHFDQFQMFWTKTIAIENDLHRLKPDQYICNITLVNNAKMERHS
jgi:hypothetical protein